MFCSIIPVILIITTCVQEITTDSLTDCELEESHTLIECRLEDGTLIDTTRSPLIPTQTKCFMEAQTHTIPVVCQDGMLILSVLDIDKLHVHDVHEDANFVSIDGRYLVRKKRFIEWIVLGISVALGTTAVVCVFLCKPENKPPEVVTSPLLNRPSPIYAERSKRVAKVSWKSPKFRDPEQESINIEIHPSDTTNGGYFVEGRHTVFFIGSDSHGWSKIASLAFEVKVHRCYRVLPPRNGYIACPDSFDILYGYTCSIKCDSGYTREGPEKIKCEKNGAWDSSRVPTCKPKECQTFPKTDKMRVECPNNEAVFGNTCEAVCDTGYVIQGPRLVRCDSEGRWGTIPKCKDNKPPYFPDGSCPNDIQQYIDAPNNTGIVKWKEPQGKDNSEIVPISNETHGYYPGMRFPSGLHLVTYTIVDHNQNIGLPCFFLISVLTIGCKQPKITKFDGKHLDYQCDTYLIGGVCNLTCMSGYPKAGADSIRCTMYPGSNPPILSWEWDKDSIEPFCKETNCSMEAINKPKNGALACSQWTHGQMCQIQCQKGFDVPYIGDGMYVCGRSDGKWRPQTKIPDCNVQIAVKTMRLPNEFYYYTGQCNNSEENLIKIKNNFVNALNTSKYMEDCIGVSYCQARFVDVMCGPLGKRRKRSVSEVNRRIDKRSTQTHAYIIEFDFIIPFVMNDEKTKDDVIVEHENILYKLSEVIQAEVDNGHFDLEMTGLRVEGDSYGPGFPTMNCPNGTVAKRDSGTCSGCPVGQFLSDYEQCDDCPVGTFQNETNTMACIPCPYNTNTTATGSVKIDQCLEYCSAGEFSPTMMSPCIQCPSHSYQPLSRSTSCDRCDSGTRSLSLGATNKSQCQVFDVQVSETRVVNVRNTQRSTMVTVFMWIFITNTSTVTSMTIVTPDGRANVVVTFSPELSVTVDTHEIVANTSIPQQDWTSVAIGINTNTRRLQLSIGGTYEYSEIIPIMVTSFVLDVNSTVSIQGSMSVSAFNAVSREVTTSELSRWSSSCTPDIDNAILTIDDLADTRNATLVIPSLCDAINECGSLPCGEHTCINLPGNYSCRCINGFSGPSCQTPPDFCENNICANGSTCITGVSNYTCTCPFGYGGKYCDLRAVNGEWSAWSMWTYCSDKCGGGTRTRSRWCDNPPADPEGEPCAGSSNQTISCNDQKCPECPVLRRTYGLRITCNKTTKLTQCNVSCRKGLFFTMPPLDLYQCGEITGYKWNHQTENNPTGRLPSCSDVEPPSKLGVNFNGKYDSIPCTATGIKRVKRALEDKLSDIECQKAGKCRVSVGDAVCESRRKKRDVTGIISVTMNIHGEVNSTQDEFNVKDVLQNGSAPSQELIDFIQQIIAIETSAQDIFNNSLDFFQLTIDGVNHSLAEGADLSVEPDIDCKPGTARQDTVCVKCPAGSYCDGRMETMCPRGQYQDNVAQSTCKHCPVGKRTPGIGSLYIEECSVIASHSPEEGSEGTNAGGPDDVIVVVGASLGALFVVVALCIIICVYKHQQHRVRQGEDFVALYTNRKFEPAN